MKRKKTVVYVVVLFVSSLLFSNGVHAERERYKRSVHKYEVPDISLLNQNRDQTNLRELLTTDKPVFLDFFYATCTTICPVLSAGFANLQRKLGDDSDEVLLVSITIDPEHDTAEVLKSYLERYDAQPGWNCYTGFRKDVDTVMRAFEAYVPNKMSHYPLTFLRDPGNGMWIRIEGLISTKDLLNEFNQVRRISKKEHETTKEHGRDEENE